MTQSSSRRGVQGKTQSGSRAGGVGQDLEQQQEWGTVGLDPECGGEGMVPDTGLVYIF